MSQLLNYRVRRLFNDRPNPHFVPKDWHKIVNWGNGRQPPSYPVNVTTVNSFEAVAQAANKLTTFERFKDAKNVRIPQYTTSRDTAYEWLRKGDVGIVARTKLSGHSGDGIILVTDKGGELPAAPLYVQYVKKQKEFRVHVAFGEVIDVQEKRQRSDYSGETNFQVRNHSTGWVYCRENIAEPDELRELALAATAALQLEFCAVDIIWNEKRNECYCLEVNTAPGLEGTTVEKYAESFVKALKS